MSLSVADGGGSRGRYAPAMGDQPDGDDLRDELLRLELAIARRDEAAISGGYAAVLDDAFRETGASGRAWTRTEMLEALAAASPSDVAIEGFAIERLGNGVVLATYESGGARPSRRASIWVLDGNRWRLRFHQGTPR
jgi:ribonuclease HI